MKSIWRIIQFSGSLWRYYVTVSVLSIVVALLAQAQPLLIGAIVRRFEEFGTSALADSVIWWFVGLLFLQDISNTLLTNVQGYFGDALSVKLQRLLSTRYYEHLLQLPQRYFDTELSGTITARLNRSIVQISNFTQMMANNFGAFILTTVFSLAIVAYYSWPVALLLFSLYPIFIFMTIRSSDTWMKYQQQRNEHQDIAFGRFQEVIGQIKVTKSNSREHSELSFFSKQLSRIVAINKPQSRHWHYRDVERKLVLNVIFGGVYGLLVWQTSRGELSIAELVMLLQFAALVRFPIFSISFLVENIQKAVSDSKDYFAVMELEPAITDASDARDLRLKEPSISFNDVTFGYEDKTVLKGVTFSIQPGQRVALVGESGAGKSTITNLLLRLYEPNSGTITIGGTDISSITQASLRSSIAMVFQDPSLFSGTIAENIAYGRPKATKAEIIEAAKSANAHEFISKFDAGYDTMIGERGLKLSGGQKQRLAIARALLKDAPILILDEATSSLDNKSELLIQEALERLMKQKTTLIIAHRLSTIQEVDCVITLKNGRVDEMGTPRALAKTDGIYARLLRLQDATGKTRQELLKQFDMVA